MDHRQIRILRYIIIPTVLTVLGIGIYYIAGFSVADMIAADIMYAVVRSEPSDYSAGDNSDGQYDTESGHEGEAVSKEGSGRFSMPQTGMKYGEIACEQIGLRVPLYYDDTEDILTKGVGQSVMSYCPGRGGTILVGGHDTTFFAPLESMAEGNEVVVYTDYGTYTYIVSDIRITDNTDYDISDDREQLVLYTCYPFGDISGDRDEKILYICDIASDSDTGGDADE